MKNNLAAMLGVVVLFSVCAWSQSDSIADASRQNQQKKPSHVIDDDNLGSAVANTRDVQNASATVDPPAEADKKETNLSSDSGDKPRSPKEEVDRQQAKVKGWLDTIEVCKKKL